MDESKAGKMGAARRACSTCFTQGESSNWIISWKESCFRIVVFSGTELLHWSFGKGFGKLGKIAIITHIASIANHVRLHHVSVLMSMCDMPQHDETSVMQIHLRHCIVTWDYVTIELILLTNYSHEECRDSSETWPLCPFCFSRVSLGTSLWPFSYWVHLAFSVCSLHTFDKARLAVLMYVYFINQPTLPNLI